MPSAQPGKLLKPETLICTCQHTHTHTRTRTYTCTHAHIHTHAQWRQRYVVFKITKSGRLEFVIYKEPPAIPDNEVKSVAIDEYGGLETNLRLESERYIFALITNSSTECFSVDSPQEMNAWIKVLQENLGKG